MKKIFTFIAIFMIATCLTACSTPDDGVFKPDTNDNSQFEQTEKSDNKKSDTETKKDDSKADDKTSESKPDNKSDNKSDNKKSDSNSSNKPAKPNGNTGSNKPSNGSNKSDSSTSKPSQSTEKPAETKPSQPAHQHTWVDHTATKQVPRTVHHDAVYEDVTIPAVTQTQIRCLGCGQYFTSLSDLRNHAMKVQMGMESGDPQRCGSNAADATHEVVITPAHTEHRLVKDAWDETVYDTQTYIDYQECTGCHKHRQK